MLNRYDIIIGVGPDSGTTTKSITSTTSTKGPWTVIANVGETDMPRTRPSAGVHTMNGLASRSAAFSACVTYAANFQTNTEGPLCHLFQSRSSFAQSHLSTYGSSFAPPSSRSNYALWRRKAACMNAMGAENELSASSVSVDDASATTSLHEERDPGEIPGTTLRVLKYPHPCLRAENVEVDVSTDMHETRRIAREMLNVMYASKGVGLAAPQVGVNQQLLVFNPEGDSKAFLQEVVMVNPRVVATSKKTNAEQEACLSFPGMNGEVKRHEWIKVEGWRLTGKKFKVKLDGWKARIFQHEFDHLNGTVYIDHLDEANRKNVEQRLDQLVEEYKQDPYKGLDPAL